MSFFCGNIDVRTLSPLVLAFIGDGVYEQYVREWIVSAGNAPIGDINQKKQALVSARFQAGLMENLLPLLSEEETAVYKRGRNAKTGSIPKNGDHSSYHSATGFEALIGYLHIVGRKSRIEELLCDRLNRKI